MVCLLQISEAVKKLRAISGDTPETPPSVARCMSVDAKYKKLLTRSKASRGSFYLGQNYLDVPIISVNVRIEPPRPDAGGSLLPPRAAPAVAGGLLAVAEIGLASGSLSPAGPRRLAPRGTDVIFPPWRARSHS